MSHYDLGCIFVLFITEHTETTHIFNAKMSGSSLEKPFQRNPSTRHTGQNPVFLIACIGPQHYS